MHILSLETDNCPSWISGRKRMTVENISWSISTKECCRPRRGLNPRPPGLQSDGASNWATEAGYEIYIFLEKNGWTICKQWRPWSDDAASDLGLHCFPNTLLRVKVTHGHVYKESLNNSTLVTLEETFLLKNNKIVNISQKWLIWSPLVELLYIDSDIQAHTFIIVFSFLPKDMDWSFMWIIF